MRRRFMGDVYYYTALPRGGEGRGGERGGDREGKHSLSPSSACTGATKKEEGVEIFVSLPAELGEAGRLVFLDLK